MEGDQRALPQVDHTTRPLVAWPDPRTIRFGGFGPSIAAWVSAAEILAIVRLSFSKLGRPPLGRVRES